MSDISQLKKRYERLNGSKPVDPNYVQAMARELGMILPEDFVEATKFFDGGGFGVLQLHAIGAHPATNVLTETKRIREAIGLPSQFLVLGEPPESFLVMDCSKGGQVVWCDAVDAKRLGREKLSQQPETWSSFGEFFEHLLDEEERDRG
jgi:hypothetical protein